MQTEIPQAKPSIEARIHGELLTELPQDLYIPPDALAQIFDAYYSTKKGGTGLGLAMARRIAEEHGGKITVTSQVGKGSDFQIHLPAAIPN